MIPHPALCILTGDFLVNLLNLGGRGPGTEPAGEEGQAGEEHEAEVRDLLLLHAFSEFRMAYIFDSEFIAGKLVVQIPNAGVVHPCVLEPRAPELHVCGLLELSQVPLLALDQAGHKLDG